MSKKAQFIEYGIGKDYLPNWGVKEALREIYQNFLDYGDYTQTTIKTGEPNTSKVIVVNDYEPEGLEFLRLGFSNKRDNANTIGQHGEGLKMAALVLIREGYNFTIETKGKTFIPRFRESLIGETLAFRVEENSSIEKGFKVTFTCHKINYLSFVATIIKPDDVIFSSTYGDIVNKEAGKIYVGGLYVTTAKGFKKAYNFKPSVIPLDRDRATPKSFDLEYYASKINEKQAKLKAEDLSHDDYRYVTEFPEEIKEQYTPKQFGNSIQFVRKTKTGEEEILRHEQAYKSFSNDNFFTEALQFIKRKMLKGLGVVQLLENFKEKYQFHLTTEGIKDLDNIIEKVKNG